ncbi:FadR/GntR family transcriptional regulator [Mesorhizobium sp. YR577]|uniref:FadR/GntR family transcriptional regulator n=1 Tax=Mesorhizobium sp. YR577 TaxID=1884373 RepID=UPI0008F25830|nr:FadR/GntR family transcriptional regulator [Mesorhizobium sp. YR577]SFT56485.1 transcriptional regulator, GntR family [Mesorhizobium sp. YR577]
MPSNKKTIPRMMSTPTPRTQHGHVIRDLGIGIVSGRYPENTIMPGDAELQQQYGVSRTVLREAFKTLAAKGVVQPKAKIGTRVLERRNWNMFDPDILHWYVETGVDSAFLMSLQEMRLALEPEAARLAAQRRTKDQIARLHHWVNQMSDTVAASFVESDLQFHITVAEASANPFMRSISTLVEVALATTFTISSPIPNSERHALTVEKHRQIALAIENSQEEAASAAMRAVINEGIERIRVVIGKEQRSPDGVERVD